MDEHDRQRSFLRQLNVDAWAREQRETSVLPDSLDYMDALFQFHHLSLLLCPRVQNEVTFSRRVARGVRARVFRHARRFNIIDVSSASARSRRTSIFSAVR
ncbi:MAG: hypothetical protein ACLVKA_08890 [Collinsella aerofaciens]